MRVLMNCQFKHSIDLVPSAPLPNGPIYKFSLPENERLPYVQQIYNISLYIYLGQNPFWVCLGFQLLSPIHVALPTASSLTNTKVDRAEKKKN
jgi:hypothetical protein